MTLIRRDRVVETSTSTGTGDLTLAAVVAGYRRFNSVMSVGDTCYVGVEAIGANGLPTGDWEIGLYTYSAANTLTRTTIHASSNADAAVSFAAGTKRVMMGLTVADFATRMQQASYRGTYTTSNAGYSWDFEDGLIPGGFTQTDALTVVSDTDGTVTQKSITFNGGNPITSNFSTYEFTFGIVADASHTSVTIRARIQCNYTTGGAWEGLRFYVDGVDQGQVTQSLAAETTYTDHVITGLAAGAHTIKVQFHTSAYSDVGFQNVRIASITNGVVTSTPYRYGDIVDYSGSRYMCLVPGTTSLPTVTTDWAPVNSAVLATTQVSARYWGLFDIEPQPDQQLVIAEVGFRITAGGAASTPSAVDGSNAGTPGNVAPGVAGNWDTYVSTSGYRAPHWVTFDFGAAIAPTEFYVDSRSDFGGGAAQAPRTLQIAYSSDGINWTPHSRYTMAFTTISQRIALAIAGVASFGAISPTAISPTYTLRGATDYDNTTAPTSKQVIAWSNSLGKYAPQSVTLSFASDIDFATAAPTDKQLLRYNNATSKWVPQTISLSYNSDVDVTTVAPTDGQTLVWNAASSKWKPGTAAGGGGTAAYPAVNVPAAATFSLVSGDATNLTLTDDTDVGILVDGGALVSGNIGRMAYKTLTNKALAWDLRINLDYMVDPTNGSGLGIYLMDSIGGKVISWESSRETGASAIVYWASLTTLGAGSIPYNPNFNVKVQWLRVASDGTNLTFYVSENGKVWSQVFQPSITAWLANKPDRVGFGMNYGRTTGMKNRMTIRRFELTGAGV